MGDWRDWRPECCLKVTIRCRACSRSACANAQKRPRTARGQDEGGSICPQTQIILSESRCCVIRHGRRGRFFQPLEKCWCRLPACPRSNSRSRRSAQRIRRKPRAAFATAATEAARVRRRVSLRTAGCSARSLATRLRRLDCRSRRRTLHRRSTPRQRYQARWRSSCQVA